MLSAATGPDITITPELWAREPHPPNIGAEEAAMRRLADVLATDPSKTFEVCANLAVQLCEADTCGISLSERTETGEEVFRWIALAGVLKEHLYGTTPRFFSPCGICVDSSAPLLMRRPELFYKYLDVGPPFHDVLLIPLTEKGSQLEGTIWIVSHDPSHKFDGEDARVMQRLAIFTATALHLANLAQGAKADSARHQLLFWELDHRVKNTLAMTASLLRRQLGGLVDPAARSAMETASGRVLAMGQVHQITSRTADADLGAVIKGVCNDVVGLDPRMVLLVDVEIIDAPAHKAAVVALIANELVTNAVKHAFSDRKAGTISVALRRIGGRSAALSVMDSGMPLPIDDKNTAHGIGLNLVGRLADQLGGTLTVEADPKRFTVIFPIDQTPLGRQGEIEPAMSSPTRTVRESIRAVGDFGSPKPPAG